MKPGLVLALLLAGCGGGSAGAAVDAGPPSFDAAPFQTLASGSGALTVAVQSDPQPPARGVDAVRFTITDSSGAPVDGLQLAVQPWMPDMGHGSSVTPEVTAQGGGVYDVTNVYLSMPGTWQLRTKFTGALDDDVTPAFQVQ